MAVKSPVMPSTNGGHSSFNHFSDSPTSPTQSQHYKRSSTFVLRMPESNNSSQYNSDSTGHLQPQPQKSPGLASPSEGPSPIVSSNGTEFEENPAEEGLEHDSSATEEPGRAKIRVETRDQNGEDFRPGSSEDEHPQSVIHAPKGFESFQANRSPPAFGRTTPTPSQRSDITVVSPQEEDGVPSIPPLSPPSISTAVPTMADKFKTPTAQTRQEVEALDRERSSRPRSSLEDIPETNDGEAEDVQGISHWPQSTKDDSPALRLALSECWTLCNTLAGLSHIHRERTFRTSHRRDGRQQAWSSCWTLCQRLYDTWDEEQPSEVGPTLSLCREFCQALFEIRQKESDLADSVLRVSFELNNHLYNTHDRTLPEQFRERTLDFYITLCHRLMKQRNKMGEETDSLLRACWSLAEMLFSLRQNRRDGKAADEELLGSAVQACWELCDLFREGWTQVRPDRGTPRPSQAAFTQAFQQAKQSDAITVTLDDADEDDDVGRQNPETPTTIFEDTAQMSPDEATVPNIVVLGPETKDRYGQWSSSSSTLSDYSSADENIAPSSATIHPGQEDPRMTCLKLLIIQAATNLGYTRNDNLNSFVKSLPSNSFGSASWQAKLLENYKRLVASDHSFRHPGPVRRASAPDIATSVRWMAQTGQYTWLVDLYRWVFGFHVDETDGRAGVVIQC